MARRILLLVATVLLVSRAATASGQCIAGSAECAGELSEPTTPTFHSACEDVVLSVGFLDYDVPAGTLDLAYSEGMYVALSVRDAFQVGGLPAGTPVTLHLRLRFSGIAFGYGPSAGQPGGTMRLATLEPEAGETPASKVYAVPYSPSGGVPFADSLDLVFTRPAGAPFGLEIHGDASHGYNFQNHARFTFLDLPPGAQVTSCKGYLQEQPTPARTASWGRLKAAYR